MQEPSSQALLSQRSIAHFAIRERGKGWDRGESKLVEL